MRSAGLAPILLLAACSGGGTSEPLANEAADAGSGVAEVYDANGTALPDGGAAAERVEAPVAAVEPQPESEPTVSPAPAGLSDAQVKEQYSPAYTACLNEGEAAQGVTTAMAACVAAELRVQDERLNAAYKSAMSKHDPAGQAALRDEERAWIKARDEKCKALAQGGTIDALTIPQCTLDETIRRRVALQPMAG